MIKSIKNYLKKYHEANLWLTERMVFEEKKKTIHAEPEIETPTEEMWLPTVQSRYIVFSNYDGGHTQEERDKIRELYAELEDLMRIPRMAIG